MSNGFEIFLSIFIPAFNFVLFYLTFSQSPGYQEKKRNYKQLFDYLQKEEDLIDEENNIINFCGDCFIKKEKRSKHCDICQRCINNFDHHCYYVDNCIGKKNLKIFAFFIFFLTFSIFLQILVQFCILLKLMNYKTQYDILYIFIKHSYILDPVHYWGGIVYLIITLIFLISCL